MGEFHPKYIKQESLILYPKRNLGLTKRMQMSPKGSPSGISL